jgi:hypothetical protein
MSNDIPVNLNWVKERAQCSLGVVFKELEHGVDEDVRVLAGLYPDDPATFSIAKGANEFSVVFVRDRMNPRITKSVDFALGKDAISVSNTHDGLMFTVGITLNNEGRCKLKTNKSDDELEQWQVRRMALEALFFGPHPF